MYRWINIFEYMDLSFISKTGKLCKRANSVYERLQNQLIDKFGISEDFLQILKNKIKIEEYYYDQIRTGNRSNQVFIEMLEIDNSDLETEAKKVDLYDIIMTIGEFYPTISTSPKTITMYEFHKYTESIVNKLKHQIKTPK
ncbi:MAG: hypothetical protein ACUZ8H_16080 [Candidatus Anammoxibacter sp.]